MKNNILIVLTAILICLAGNVHGQKAFPVNIVTQAMPPHSGVLSDFVAPGLNKMAVTMVLNDINELSYQVRLKLTIEGGGIRIETNPNANFNPITLSYGAPVHVISADLIPYFDLNNLVFSGITKQQYLDQGGLPDMLYNFCFEAVDYDRSSEDAASAPSCALIDAVVNDPPVILSPIGTTLTSNPQQLAIQWQAMHTGTFPTEYDVEVYEYPEASTLTIDQIFDFQQPFFSKTLMSATTTVVSAADPPMVGGRRYLLRVRARDITDTHFFKNQGWSEYQEFYYGDQCQSPEGLQIVNSDAESAELGWLAGFGYTTYLVRYRNISIAGSPWYEDETNFVQHTVAGLTEGASYEFQVGSLCGGTNPSSWSQSVILDIPIPDLAQGDYQCGDVPSLTKPLGLYQVPNLNNGDQIKIGHFNMLLTSVTKNGDSYAGKGKIYVPWIGRNLKVVFGAIKVNAEKEVYDGNVEAETTIEDKVSSPKSPEQDFSFCEMPANTSQDSSQVDTTAGPVAAIDTTTGPSPTDSSLVQGGTNPNDTSFVAPSTVGSSFFHDIEGSVLPVGLKPDGVKYTIMINKMVFFPNKAAQLDAKLTTKIPGINRNYTFVSKGTSFHPGGMSGESRLMLPGKISVPLQGKFRLNILTENNNSYVSWDCNGFKKFSLDASVDICPSIIVPVDANLKPDTTSYVTSKFYISVEDLESVVVELSIQPFEVRRLPGFVWSVDRAVFDFSDKSTPAGMQFPINYNHPDVSSKGAPGKLWQGFYMKSARVKLPDAITQSDTTDQFDIDFQTGAVTDTQLIHNQVRKGITVGVQNLVIDYTGFSGAIFGTDLLTLEEGKIGTWRMSVDSIAVNVKQNIPNGGAFMGKLRIPMFDSTTLGYKAVIMPMTSQYLFKVDVKDQMVLKSGAMGGSSFVIDKNSAISVEYTELKGFIAKAVLNGTATFSSPVKSQDNGSPGQTASGPAKDSLQIHGIAFQDLELSTKEPYLKPGTWQYSSNGKQDELGKFPITINAIGFIKDQVTEEVGFVIDADVNLMKDTSGGFAAGGRIMVLCNIDVIDGVQQWSFSRVKVERLSLDVSGPGYAFKGRIDFFENNPVFGTGMRGAIRASFQPKIEVGAVIQFGEVDGYRYWFADAAVSFAPGVPLGPSGLSLYGFGGGAYYHMRREGFSKVTLPEPTPGSSKDSLSFDDIPSALGQSLTGIKYVPDNSILIGIKAMVALGTASREVFNAELQFEINFNASGGLNQIGFLGDARFMTPPGPDQDPQLRVVLDMLYDFPNESFHAQLDVYVNAAGGVIRGAYPLGLAGTGVIHADPKDWYIHLGTPDNRVRLALDPKGMANMKAKKSGGGRTAAQDSLIPDIGIMLTAYLDVGTIIPDFPTPFSHNPAIRSKVQAILGDIDLPARTGNPLLDQGGGIIFGATLDVIMPELTFLIFYAEFAASLGFDVMLKNYGPTARCAGNEASDQPIGINGWYATGQFFAYIAGAIGIKVNIFGIKGKFEILSLAAAAVLQAKLPEPFWARGIVGGQYRILGGLIKGKCRFEFEAGKVCDIVGASQLAGLEMISSVTPDGNSASEVDVFIRPQVAFNIAIGEVFTLTNDNGDDIDYKPRLTEFAIIDSKSKQAINGQIDWNYANDLLAFKPFDVLTGNRKYELKVRVQFDTRKEGEGWKLLLNGENKPEQQERIVEFTTGPAPDYIPEHNIAYSYPVINQYQFLKGESANGYVKLKQGQPYLFDVDRDKWNLEAYTIQNAEIVSTSALSYNGSDRQVNFAIAANQIKGNELTHLRLVNAPAIANVAIDANLNVIEADKLSGVSANDFNTMLVEERKLEGSIEALEVTDMLSYHFRTSFYNTLREKMLAADISGDWFNPLFTDASGGSALSMDEFGVYYSSSEYFDEFDQIGWHNGDEQIKPLIYAEADLNVTGDNWYNQLIFPYMYQHLPSGSLQVTWRSPTEELGVIPVLAAGIYQNGEPQRLTEQEVSNNALNPQEPITGIKYTVPYRMFMDHFEFKNAVNHYAVNNSLSPGLENFLNGNFVYPKYGEYKLKLHYRLPGSESIHSTTEIMIPYGIANKTN